MKSELHINANGYLRDILTEVKNLSPTQKSEDFLNFFKKNEIFSIGVICDDTNKIKEYFQQLSQFLYRNNKIVFLDLDEMVQNWNESIYIIKEENSIGSQFLNIVNNSIIAKKLYYEKIGTIDYDINDALFIYEIREHDWVAIISNNHLLLKDEGQRRKYVDEYINFISKITTNKRIRKTIPKSVKSKLWIQHFGEEVANGNCYVCETKIRIDNFEAGHVIPDSQDGQPTIDNLKPVCSLCNKSMGDENLYDYKEKHFPEKNRSFGGRSFAPLIPLYPSPKTKNLI